MTAKGLHSQTDRLFKWLLIAQWVFAVAFVTATTARPPLDAYLAIFGGGALALVPIYFIYKYPSTFLTYRDWTVLASVSVIAAIFSTQSGHGFEHAIWFVFEDAFLIYACVTSQREQRLMIPRESEQSNKMAALGHMAGNIAHEINTPLGIISLLAEQIQLHAASLGAPEQVEGEQVRIANAAEKIEMTVDRISKIIDSLRRFSRQDDAGPYELVSLHQVVNDTLDLCRHRFRVGQISVEVAVADGLQARCRPVQISQVLTNLLNNSFDAISQKPKAWIKITASASADRIKLSVIDSGSGIPCEIREKIMQPFFTTKDVGKGTGVGLSISQQIMASHGGDLTINGANFNTEFILTFPRATAHSASLEAA